MIRRNWFGWTLFPSQVCLFSGLMELHLLLQVLTNALYKSIPHRAVVNRTQARISLAYFYAPQTGAEIVPSPELLERKKQSSIYKRFTMEEYLAVKKGQLLNTLEHFTLKPPTQYLAYPAPTPALAQWATINRLLSKLGLTSCSRLQIKLGHLRR